jgi:hypothetical protein
MLVFPSLGSQAEVSQNRPKDSEYPWNTTMYPETPATSIYFFGIMHLTNPERFASIGAWQTMNST